MKAGMKRAASAIETTPAMINPSAVFPGNKNAAAMSATPEIAPATIEAVLPAFTYNGEQAEDDEIDFGGADHDSHW